MKLAIILYRVQILNLVHDEIKIRERTTDMNGIGTATTITKTTNTQPAIDNNCELTQREFRAVFNFCFCCFVCLQIQINREP